MISVVQNENVYEISFKYDPTLISMVKQVPGRCWIPSAKHWTIPLNSLGFLLNQLKGTMYENAVVIQSEEDINKNEEIESSTKIPNIDISDVNFRIADGLSVYKHQLDFMRWAKYRQVHGNFHGFLLCDEQGLSKTVECANLAIYNREHYGFTRCLIICCVNPAKYHWVDDIQKHTNSEYVPYILGTRKKKDGSLRYDTGTKEKLEDLISGHIYGDNSQPILPYFIVMNIEGLRARDKKKYPIADAIINMIDSNELSMIAVDEIHKNTSPTSLQGKQLLRIKKSTGSKVMWIPITGTPITSRPTNVFLPLKLVDGHKYTSYYTWSSMFCIYGGFGDHEIIGYRNIPYLKEMLESNMIRRLKKDVLDLPPKIYYTEYVDITPYQSKLYRLVVSDLLCNKESILQSLNPMTKFLRLRQVVGSPELVDDTLSVNNGYEKHNSKYKRMIELLEEIHERGEKAIIFSNWVAPLRTLYSLLSKKYHICVYTGTMKDEDREKHKHVFINNPKYTILLGTIGALGVMHTLTCANNIIFLDEPWTASEKQQAEDRCHRVSTTKPVNIYTLLAKSTIDERVHNILYKKEGISNYIVDNIDIHSNPELFDLLLSDTLKK